MGIKIQLEISDRNECTAAPWWAVLDPRRHKMLRRGDVHGLAGMITGPFFSREEAQEYLDGNKHNHSDKALVYCLSGWNSGQYAEALKLAQDVGE